MQNGHRILDADAHVIEPGDLFGDAQADGLKAINLPPNTPMIPCGDLDLIADQVEHGFDAPSYLRAMECASLAIEPSAYFARQCVICSDPEDRLVGMTVSHVGADHVLWASDFPHPDAAFPTAVDEFLAAAAASGLGGTDLEAVLWDTSVRFYGLENRFAGPGH